jgi:uncharacterized membrane protein
MKTRSQPPNILNYESGRAQNGGMEIAQVVVAVALAIAFVAMGVLHFVPSVSRGMASMIPPRMRFTNPRYLVWFTGVCEIAGGLGLLIPQLRVIAVLALIVFLVAVFPANAYAAQHPEKFGRVAVPFWPRLTAQLLLIAVLAFVAL